MKLWALLLVVIVIMLSIGPIFYHASVAYSEIKPTKDL